MNRFQAKGMDVGVSSDIFNSINYEESSSSDEDQNGTNYLILACVQSGGVRNILV